MPLHRSFNNSNRSRGRTKWIKFVVTSWLTRKVGDVLLSRIGILGAVFSKRQ